MNTAKSKMKNKQAIVHKYEIVCLVLMILAFLTVLISNLIYIKLNDTADIVNTVVMHIALLFASMLYSVCISGTTWNAKQKLLFEYILILFYVTCLFQTFTIFITRRGASYTLSMFCDAAFYVLVSLYWVAFWFFQRDKYIFRINLKHIDRLVVTYFSIYIIVAVVNGFTGFCSTYNAEGKFIITGQTLNVMTYLWFGFYFLLIVLSKCNKKTKFTLLSYSVFPLTYLIILYIFSYSKFAIDIATSMGCLVYLVPLYLLFFNIYLERGELLLLREKELEKSRANVMALQINPHFIANTISSIVALCDPGSPEAGDLASKFARYLRDNYTKMSSENLILFNEEMEYVKNYLDIEKVRFPNLEEEYDIKSDKFLVPTLTIQTLVENAIRHGIQKKAGASGKVKIKAYEDDNYFFVEIIDDGVGFSEIKVDDGKSHIGIENVKSRLQLLCDGTLKIESEVGVGTTCTVAIPKTNSSI